MITRYRKYEYADELDEDAVWYIYSFDQEFGKFVKQKKKIADVLEKVIKYNP
jgi:transcriptional accessory protein Tex/SPT6